MSAEELNMEYNSSLSNLVMPEYGRSFQKLVAHCVEVEDPTERQLYAERLIKLMTQMQPNYKYTAEHFEKLWNQMLMVADYKLDVKVPDNITITEHKDKPKPQKLEYPGANRLFRHYGNHVLTMIDSALAMEDGPKKDTYINVIGSYMKLAYRTWSRDHYVSDEVIISDLAKISKGKINLSDDTQLNYLKETLQNARAQSNKPKHKKRSNNKRQGHSNKRRKK